MPNLLAVPCFERPCQVYICALAKPFPHLKIVCHFFCSFLSTFWVCLAVFINCFSFCSQELLAAVEDEKRMRSRNTTTFRAPLDQVNAYVRYSSVDL